MEEASTSTPRLQRGHPATITILVINIAIYILMETQGGPTYDNLLRFGAKENGLIALGQWHRLFAPMFLHAGLLHLGFNMYALYQVGRVVEYIAGSKGFLIIYFLGGFTATLCSFALSPPLSVGASGSLYAILLALYVFQKYEEKLAARRGVALPKSPLGTLIILNGLITFIIPNIDWAAHLGGAIGGTLIGLAIVARHRWEMRMARCRPFLDPRSQAPHRPLTENPRAILIGLAVVNLAFFSRIFFVTPIEKAFGAGFLRSTEIKDQPRNLESISTFGDLVNSQKSVINPIHLMKTGYAFHSNDYYYSAFLSYHSALLVSENAKNSVSSTDLVALHTLVQLALKKQPVTPQIESLLPSLSSFPDTSLTTANQKSREAAELFSTLGFFELSAKMFEAHSIGSGMSMQSAVNTIASMKKIPMRQTQAANLGRFQEIMLKSEREGSTLGTELSPSDYWKWADKEESEEWQRNQNDSEDAHLPPI